MSNYKTNRAIRAHQVRLIDESGEQVGIVPIETARLRAENAGLDLVEISGKANPPVVKIINYGKFKYDQDKKEKEAKKKQREAQSALKELWFRPGTDQHDIDIKLKKAKGFLEKGDRVKLGIRFRGREMATQDQYVPILENIAGQLEGDVISNIAKQGKTLVTIIGPQKKVNENE